jgi:putative flippase GtrA
VKTLLRPGQRQLLFLCVGVTCFLTQYAALTAMAAAGTYRPLANALGFAISAQLNFVLSVRLTWRDRPTAAARTLWARWASYNGTALISLAVNTVVFTAAYHRIGNLSAAALGVLCGMCVTYLVCDLLIFRERGRPQTASRSRRRPLHAGPAFHAGPAVPAPVAVTWDRPAVPPRERPAIPPWEQAGVPPWEQAAATSWDQP